MSAAVAIEEALDSLEDAGARSIDAPGCDCVRRLLNNAEELGGGTAERLLARAQSHLDQVRQRVERARDKTSTRLTELQQRGMDPAGQLQQAFDDGDLQRVETAARQLRRTAGATRLARRPMGAQVSPAGMARQRRRVSALRYDDSVAEWMASNALASAMRTVPRDAGPYNSLRIASRAIQHMGELSPTYLRAQLERLDELSSLMALPELEPPPKPKKKAAARKRKPRATKARKR